MILFGARIAAGPFAALPEGAFGLCLDPHAANRADAALVLDIPDFGLPDPGALRATLDALRAAMVAEPERLFYIGCKAGLGRSGTVLACLARESGITTDPVAWVRADHHPLAVETPAQAAFARAWPVRACEGIEFAP